MERIRFGWMSAIGPRPGPLEGLLGRFRAGPEPRIGLRRVRRVRQRHPALRQRQVRRRRGQRLRPGPVRPPAPVGGGPSAAAPAGGPPGCGSRRGPGPGPGSPRLRRSASGLPPPPGPDALSRLHGGIAAGRAGWRDHRRGVRRRDGRGRLDAGVHARGRPHHAPRDAGAGPLPDDVVARGPAAARRRCGLDALGRRRQERRPPLARPRQGGPGPPARRRQAGDEQRGGGGPEGGRRPSSAPPGRRTRPSQIPPSGTP
jgi:hypothetical protein